MENLIEINFEHVCLEGLIHKKSDQKAVIVCHPHPLYGGSMDNPVVTAVADSFFVKGYTTLRFNFRGVGNSTGAFDDGVGEQDDVRAATAMLVKDGFKKIVLAGYSFGAWINTQVMADGCNMPDHLAAHIADHIMVSPPVGFMRFDDIDTLCRTGLIICGDCDEYAPVPMIETCIKKWRISSRLEIIKNGDHFYSASLGTLRKILEDYLS
ncbi:MAG: alpha/beta hydrolase [Proteobacteria bacterium]|nr:alpha/beta hydrolase [Pseudomonadota bacterium]MBU1387263.1 alpha/beta hydrolase [Pseudomonadota bacterium]MBU1544244.1 alpha/beta hydrolase [Pseudomonadota bacterium]MBU2430441.1 alpha/beta hydrolase [Pseudomonadota bacterium]MBU2480599.1 alpha/beta hydrolase [Pseudomonadota bacterium]